MTSLIDPVFGIGPGLMVGFYSLLFINLEAGLRLSNCIQSIMIDLLNIPIKKIYIE